MVDTRFEEIAETSRLVVQENVAGFGGELLIDVVKRCLDNILFFFLSKLPKDSTIYLLSIPCEYSLGL